MSQPTLQSYKVHVYNYLNIVWKIAISLLSVVFIAMADKLMIMRLGEQAYKNVTTVNLIVMVPILLSIGCSSVLASVTANGHARKSYQEATDMLYGLWMLCGIIAVIFGLVVTLGVGFLLGNLSPAILANIQGFYWTVCLSALFDVMSAPLRRYMEGLGWFKFNMLSSLLCGLLNIMLNYLFIYGWGIIPALGVLGAGVATLIVRLIVFMVYLYMVFGVSKRRGELLAFTSVQRQYTWRKCKDMLMYSLPGGAQLASRAILYKLMNRMLHEFQGDVQTAGVFIFDLVRYTYVMFLAVSITGMNLMSRNSSKNNSANQRRIAVIGYGLHAVMTCLVWSIVLLVYPYMLDVLKPPATIATKQMVMSLIGYAWIVPFCENFNTLGIYLLRAKRDVLIPVLISVGSLFVLGLPACFFLGITYGMGIQGLFIGIMIGFATSGGVLLGRLMKKTA